MFTPCGYNEEMVHARKFRTPPCGDNFNYMLKTTGEKKRNTEMQSGKAREIQV